MVIEPALHDHVDVLLDALVDHPWRGWAEWQDGQTDASVSTQGGSRWNAGKDLSFVPLAMGLSIGAPDRVVVSFSGDAGFLMVAGELATASELGLRTIFVVFVDASR